MLWTGSTIVQRVDDINKVGLKVSLFCDSDRQEINQEKIRWKDEGIFIFDCDDSLCLEEQVFKDLPWNGVKARLQHAKDENPDSFDSAFSEFKDTPVNEWDETEESRDKIISEFKPRSDGGSGKKWFKVIHHGEALGGIIFKNFSEMEDDTRLKTILTDLSDWVDA